MSNAQENAKTILRQIGAKVLFAIGADRKQKIILEDGIQFFMSNFGRKSKMVQIRVSGDTYNITVLSPVRMRKGEIILPKVLEELKDIYSENLSDVMYNLCNKHCA